MLFFGGVVNMEGGRGVVNANKVYCVRCANV